MICLEQSEKELDLPRAVILHGGLNKAGSTYLQGLFAQNFSRRSRSAICYPKPHLTSGNAGKFLKAIRVLDEHAARAELRRLLTQGQEDQTLLLSTETAYHQFVKADQRDLLYSCFASFDVESVDLVFVFRNIFEHAISAYCHRCGVHKMPRFEDWISDSPSSEPTYLQGVTCYEFWSEINLFNEASADDRFVLHYLPYSKRMQSWWSEFLNIPMNDSGAKVANVSPTLSEAEALRVFRNVSGIAVDSVRRKLKTVNREEKAKDLELQESYWSLLADQLQEHRDSVRKAEEIIGFDISAPPVSNKRKNTNPSVKLSEPQLNAMFKGIRDGCRIEDSLKGRIKRMVPETLWRNGRELYKKILNI